MSPVCLVEATRQKRVLVVRGQQACSGAVVDVIGLRRHKSALCLVGHHVNGFFALCLAVGVSTILL